MSQEWDIKSRGDACERCETPFADLQSYYTRLSFGEEGYARIDLCENCNDSSDDSGTISIWKGVFKMPPPKAEEPLKKENAESLLRKFMEEDDDSKRNAVYILAVMLERKKLLVEREVQHGDDDLKLRVYEHKGTGETFLIPDPQLKLSEIESVQEEVVVLLGGKAPDSDDPEPVEASEPADAPTTN